MRVDKNKSGQFYLLAAIVIVGVLLGMAAVTNYVVTRQSDVKQGDITEELKIEAENVIGNGIIHSADLEERLDNFAGNYSEYYSEGYDVLFIYGDAEAIDAGSLNVISIFSRENLDSVSLLIGNSQPTFVVTNQKVSKGTVTITEVRGDILEVTIEDVSYQFRLNEGNLFYFIIQQPVENDF